MYILTKKLKERLTTDYPSGIVENLLNFAFEKDGFVHLRKADGFKDKDLCETASEAARIEGVDIEPKDILENGVGEFYDRPFAILYTLGVQAAELRNKLKHFEDAIEDDSLLLLAFKPGDDIYWLPEKRTDVLDDYAVYRNVNGDKIFKLTVDKVIYQDDGLYYSFEEFPYGAFGITVCLESDWIFRSFSEAVNTYMKMQKQIEKYGG